MAIGAVGAWYKNTGAVGDLAMFDTAYSTIFAQVNGYELYWVSLLILFVYFLGIGTVVTTVILYAKNYRLLARIFTVLAFLMVGCTFVISVWISEKYWGYYFARPAVMHETHEIETISAVIPVTTETDDAGKRLMAYRDDFSISKAIDRHNKARYYSFEGRILQACSKKTALPDAHTESLDSFPAMFPLIQGTGLLAAPSNGYNDSDNLKGLIVEARSYSGERLVFLGLRGGQVSNDHYPYYELLFKGDDSATGLSYVRGQRFFYDSAGIEGIEWPVLWMVLTSIGLVPLLLVCFAWIITWTVWYQIHKRFSEKKDAYLTPKARAVP